MFLPCFLGIYGVVFKLCHFPPEGPPTVLAPGRGRAEGWLHLQDHFNRGWFESGPHFPGQQVVKKRWPDTSTYQWTHLELNLLKIVFSIQSYGSECVTPYSMDWTWFARSPRWFLTWCEKATYFLRINVYIGFMRESLFGPWGLVTEMPSWTCWT